MVDRILLICVVSETSASYVLCRFSNSRWAKFCQTFACSTCKAGMVGSLSRPGDAEEPEPVSASRGQHYNSNYCSDGERQLVIEESFEKKRTMCQQTFHHQLYNTKLGLVHLKWAVILLVTGVVTRIVLIQTTQPQEFGGAPFVVASNFRVVTPLSNKLKGLTLIFYSIILKKILLWMQIKRIVTLKIVLGNDSWSNS